MTKKYTNKHGDLTLKYIQIHTFIQVKMKLFNRKNARK